MVDGAEGMRVVLEGVAFGKGKMRGTARVVCVDGDVREKGKLGLKACRSSLLEAGFRRRER